MAEPVEARMMVWLRLRSTTAIGIRLYYEVKLTPYLSFRRNLDMVSANSMERFAFGFMLEIANSTQSIKKEVIKRACLQEIFLNYPVKIPLEF